MRVSSWANIGAFNFPAFSEATEVTPLFDGMLLGAPNEKMTTPCFTLITPFKELFFPINQEVILEYDKRQESQ